MTIKAKLFLNMALMIVGILIIGGLSITGMQFVKGKLSVLTEKSTPYQLKTIELQSTLQEHTSNLIRMETASSLKEFAATKVDAEKTLADTKTIAAALAAFKAVESENSAGMAELASITNQISSTTEERLKAEEAGRAADALMKGKLQEAARKLHDLENSMKKIQSGSMRQVTTANASVKHITQKVKQVQVASAALNEVKMAVLEISAADNRTALTVAKSHFTVATRRLLQTDLVTEQGTSISALVTDSVGEITKQVAGASGGLELKAALLANPNDETKKQLEQNLGIVNQKLSQMTTVISDVVEKASDEYLVHDKSFDSSLKGANSASNVMSQATALVAVGSETNRLIKELFAASTPQELDQVKAELVRQLDQAAAVQRGLGSAQSGQLRGALACFSEIRGLLMGKDGVIEKLQHVLVVKAKAQELNDKLKNLVAQQHEEGKKGVTSAQGEQAKAVTAVNRIFATNIVTVSVVSLAVLVLGILLSTILARLITTPINELTRVAEQFGHGDFSTKLNENRKDEFGDLARHFNRATSELQGITSHIRSAMGQLASNASNLTATAEALNQGARTQTAQTDQSAAAMTEMTQTIMDVARNAGSAADGTRKSLDLAAQGKKVVLDTVNGMQEIVMSVRESSASVSLLGENSAKIGTIVDVITDIADQTNLLALNAAIEAARAGEQGRGFAVVADEVRNLAEKTTNATQEIAEMIRLIQANTESSVKAMQKGQVKVEEGMSLASQAGGALESIVEASGTSVDMVQTIATAAEEQSAVASEVSANMENIASISRKAESATEEITKAAEQLNSLAAELNQKAAWFKA